jgi:hypothetical protein
MKLIIEAQLADDNGAGELSEPVTLAVVECSERDFSQLGLSLAKGRALLAAAQSAVVSCQTLAWLATSEELCGGGLKPAAAARLRCTAEHLVPRSEGGQDIAENIAAACAHCNGTRRKRKRPPEPTVYEKEVARRERRGFWHQQWVFERGPL